MADDSRATARAMTGADLESWLVRWNLSDANAARLCGVSGWSVKHWRKDGVTGSAAVLLRLMVALGASPYSVAATLGIPLSGLGRRGFHGHATGEAHSAAVGPAIPVEGEAVPEKSSSVQWERR